MIMFHVEIVGFIIWCFHVVIVKQSEICNPRIDQSLASGSEPTYIVVYTTGAIFLYIYIFLSGEATYRIFLNVSTRFFFTVTSRHFTGHTYTLDSHGKVILVM